jgi:pimeloyl-ACP methyl ester carboxylesterase
MTTLEADGRRTTIEAGGIPFSTLGWGAPDGRPLLLVHGVTASAAVWWQVGPALATTGRSVLAVDLPGHGRTGHWTGRRRFAETAEDLASFVRAAGFDRPELQVVGHSWGAMVSATLPIAGIRPATIVLLDPPALPVGFLVQMANDPTWRTFDSMTEATAAIAAANPTWPTGYVEAAAEAMLEVDVDAARAVVLENGDWDAGLAALAAPAAAGIPVWVIRGEPAAGGLTLDPAAEAFRERYGDDHVITIAGGPHGPQRTHIDATIDAIRAALGS